MNATASLLADTICRTVELGVTITDAAVADELTLLFCAPVTLDPICAERGTAGRMRDLVERKVTDLPTVGYRTRLHVRVPRFTCDNTEYGTRIFQQRISALAEPRTNTTRRCTRWILQPLAIDRTSVTTVAKALGLGGLVNDLAVSETRTMVYDQPGHFDGVRILGVDEHQGKHIRGDGSSSFVTGLIDMTPVVDGTGPSRLLDMVPGRSAKVLTEWLDARDLAFQDRVKVVTMDGLAGYHTAAANAVPEARTVMDPFHVVHLAADKLTVCRQRIQQATTGHRGRTGGPLYGIRRTLRTCAELLTDKQKVRLFKAFTAGDAHVAVEVTYSAYQRLIAAYEASGKREGKIAMYKLLRSIRAGVPKELPELAQLGRSLWSGTARSSPTSTPVPPTGPSRPSTVASNSSAESLWASEISSTTSCGP
ncbi:ISL3-like element IS31831 family transposase [Corynebacterium nasicanis]